jgi:hypothetical protein
LFDAIDVQPPLRDSLVDALLDWRDADGVPRLAGAERDWYTTHRQSPPRNGPLASPLEILRIAGFDRLSTVQDSQLVSMLTVNGDLVDLSHASRAVLETLPGFSTEVADAVISARSTNAGAADLMRLMGLLPERARDSIAANFDRLVTRATAGPTRWVLVVEAWSGAPQVELHMELLITAGSGRIGAVRRRFWLD